MLILIPLVVLALAGGGFLAYSQYVTLATIMHDDESDTETEAGPIEYGEFLELENLIINPSGTDGTRYLMVKIAFESAEAKALEEVTSKNVVVRDAILRFLQSKTVEDLSSIEQREEIKHDLRELINEILDNGDITRLYFTQYVLQ